MGKHFHHTALKLQRAAIELKVAEAIKLSAEAKCLGAPSLREVYIVGSHRKLMETIVEEDVTTRPPIAEKAYVSCNEIHGSFQLTIREEEGKVSEIGEIPAATA